MPRDPRHRGFCFTAWPQIEDKDKGELVENFDWDSGTVYEGLEDRVKFLVVGKEVSESGRQHHQGYILWKNPTTRAATIRALPHATWVAAQRAEHNYDAAKYCWKDDDIVCQFGDPPKAGERNDIRGVKEMVQQGCGMREITDTWSSLQDIKVAEALLKYKEAKRSWAPEVYWYWGPPGSGKTKLALEKAGADVWLSGRNLKWWYDYDAHTDVIIDDFRGDYCTFHELLRILDRTPYSVETKGGHRQLLAKRIWITSCYPPQRVYSTREDIGQLLRRITRVMEFKPPPAAKPQEPELWDYVDGREVLRWRAEQPDGVQGSTQPNPVVVTPPAGGGGVVCLAASERSLTPSPVAQAQGLGVTSYPNPPRAPPDSLMWDDDFLRDVLGDVVVNNLARAWGDAQEEKGW